MGLVGYFLYSMKYGNSTELFNKYANKPKNLNTQNINLDKLIYDYSPVYGNDDAPVTILAFEDFECPFCRKSFPIVKKIKEKYGSAIKIIFKNTPIVSIHKQALLAHIYAMCASEQGKFWEYYDLLYSTQKLDKSSLVGYAELLSINNTKFKKCSENKIPLPNIYFIY